DNILQAAAQTHADALHPGYGFLSENAAFATACGDAGIAFIGPSAGAIEAMGNKAEAKRLMLNAGVPCVPGYEGEDQNDAALISHGKRIGFPLMVKAAAGGGGRGMRLVTRADDLGSAIAMARSESENAFASGELILERAIVRPRHVEIQIIADQRGHTLYLGERDCSVQRRHQKVLEESPSPVMTPELRASMGAAAVKAAQCIDYVGAGTVEFLLDQEGRFYFLEMNTRLQVEHPVTEMVTGLDLVALQIQVARGEVLPLTQDEVQINGHAIEARIYAEDPAADFMPATGRIERWQKPAGAGVRVDDGVRTGQVISPFYDSMVAKVITHGATRDEALAHLHAALKTTVLFGPANNIAFLLACIEATDFKTGKATTDFVGATFGEAGFTARQPVAVDAAVGAALRFFSDQKKAWEKSTGIAAQLLGWSTNAILASPYHLKLGDSDFLTKVSALAHDRVNVHIGDELFAVRVVEDSDGAARVHVGNDIMTVHYLVSGEDDLYMLIEGTTFRFVDLLAEHVAAAVVSEGSVLSPMHGTVIEVCVSVGDVVEEGARLAVLEAMKMQHELVAPVGGKVVAVSAVDNKQVAADELLIEIEAEQS
ncbi:MAG: ATP-grasp domain-containing protein, partial [Gammaproteobacteria bacterium]|nr:ATP-grasp domain-containing protein [Gammaproteobacteria bacterium]